MNEELYYLGRMRKADPHELQLLVEAWQRRKAEEIAIAYVSHEVQEAAIAELREWITG